MRTKSSSAFTLIEVITALAIIVILAGIVVSLAGYVNNKANRSRAKGEMAMLQAALENYKAETGGYPQDIQSSGSEGVTDKLKPKIHFIPTAKEYEDSSLFLYKQLTGDKTGTAGTPDGIPDTDEPQYLKQYDRKKILMVEMNTTTNTIKRVKGFQDPWGYYYGYSTAAARTEREFQKTLKTNSEAARPTGDQMPGFNNSSFDLWTTAGAKPSSNPTNATLKTQEWAKWEKNW